MLPLTLVLLLMLRMNVMLGFWEQLAHKEQNFSSNDIMFFDYETGHEQLSDYDKAVAQKQCPIVEAKFNEMFEHEVPDILRDVRTSYLPYDFPAMPIDCTDALNLTDKHMEDWQAEASLDDKSGAHDSILQRHRRDVDSTPKFSSDDIQSEMVESKEEKLITHTISSLDSFWDEGGNTEIVRREQAKTMLKYMDQRVDPCQDFYKYACGNWERLHPIPKDKAGFDTFEILRESLDNVLKQLLESPVSKSSKSKSRSLPALQSNHYAQHTNTEADITAESFEEREEKQRLREHIIERRAVLERILQRIKRQNMGNKNAHSSTERLNPYHNSSRSVSSMHEKGDPSEFYEGLEDAQVKAKQLYQSCMNNKLLAKRGVQPLLKLIDDLGGWPVLNSNWNAERFDWLNLTAQLRRYNNDILIVQWVGPDIKNSDENIIQFDQTNFGLPTREYFLQDINSKYLMAYQRFMSDVMHKIGVSRNLALKTATELVAFETQLASITAPAEQRVNVTKLYRRKTLKELKKAVPQINWVRYLTILQDRHVKDSEHIVIFAEDYMRKLVSLIAETPPRTVANYLIWRFVRHRINNVDDRFDDTKQNFYHALFGREESPPRWKVCVAQVNTNMGMAVGAMFVSRYFDENSKRDTLRMTHEIQQAFRDILRTTDWIDHKTKHLAEEKVNAMSLKIGYPDFILNPIELNNKYEGLEIHPEQYFENTLNVLLHTALTEQKHLSERVNKTHWQTAPAIVNAYYSRNKNQIMFPAGILQPPFYHRYFPRALNFGGIGVVIGHELTHGFDDKGRLFDSNGNIHKWWSDYAIRGFDDRARCIIAQYNNYTVTEVGIRLNGESTQGENIADNGGLRQAFHAYTNWRKKRPSEALNEHLPGLNLTGPQLFFLNFGQIWCGAMRPEATRNKLNTAIHSPGRFRVIGTLSNSYDFAKVYKCAPNTPMNPERKCTVW